MNSLQTVFSNRRIALTKNSLNLVRYEWNPKLHLIYLNYEQWLEKYATSYAAVREDNITKYTER